MAGKLRRAPTRMVTGAFILNSGLQKLGGTDEESAKAMHGMASGAYPVLDSVEPKMFVKMLGAGETALGSALLLPIIPARLAGAGLLGFSGSLLGMWWRTPGMHDGLRPTQQGTAIAKDSWMLGIGAGLLLDDIVSGPSESHAVRKAERRAGRRARKAEAKLRAEELKHELKAASAERRKQLKSEARKRAKALQAEAKAQAKSQAKSARAAVLDGAESARKAALDTAGSARKSALDTAGSARKSVRKAADHYVDSARDSAADAGKSVRKTAEQYGESARKSVQQAGGAARDAAAQAGKSVRSTARSTAEPLADKVGA